VAAPVAEVRIVEGVPVVTRLRDTAQARAAGVRVGDVVARIDGEAPQARIERLARVIPASTPQALRSAVGPLLLNGPEGSTAVLALRGADGREREARLPRRSDWPSPRPDTTPAWRMLDGNVGYVDLVRLAPSQVDAILAELGRARGIVFDLRGYPFGTWPVLAPRLARRDTVVGALFHRRDAVDAGGPFAGTRGAAEYRFDQFVAAAEAPRRYTGPTLMLIDERAVSQAEHTGLFLRAANGTRFVGTPTAGTNGDQTIFFLPGGITVSPTGQGVRWPDGRQLQRVGLLPDVEEAPTIAGIRAGRDEVLERAVQVLVSGS